MPRTSASTSDIACVGYVRRSTDMQDQSLDDQRAAIEQYAAEHGLDILKWYIDDAISGTTARDRDAFLAMVDDAQNGGQPFSRVLVYDVTRFGRMDSDETGYYRHLLRRCGVEVEYAAEAFGDTPDDELIRSVKQWLARQESRDRARVSIRGWLSKMGSERGWWMGGVEPYGYDRRYEDRTGRFLYVVRTMPDRSRQVLDRWGRLERTLEPGERLVRASFDRCKLVLSAADRVAVVQRIFDDYVSGGLGAPAIAARLNDDGVPPPRLGRNRCDSMHAGWRYASIRNILSNPVYTGDMVWNRRTCGKLFRVEAHGEVPRPLRDAATVRWNPRDRWLTVPGTHPVIVGRETFGAAAALVVTRCAAGRPASPLDGDNRESSSGYPLTGLVGCAVCGERVLGIGINRFYYDRRNTPYRARVYACRRRGHRGKASSCRSSYVRRRILDAAISDRVTSWYRSRLTASGRAAIRELAATHCQQVSAACGGASRSGRRGEAARHTERSAIAFMEALPGPFLGPSDHARRLAFGRCIDQIRLDAADGRAEVWVRRLPINGARAGGVVRLVVRFPVPHGDTALGPRKRDRAEQRYDLDWHARSLAPSTRALFDQMCHAARRCGPDVRETCRQQYVAYTQRKHFAMIKVRRGCLLLYLKIDLESIHRRQRVCSMRDVRHVGTATTGRLELTVDSAEALEQALPWIQRSYEAVVAT